MRFTRRLLEPNWTESSIAGQSPVRNEKARRRPSRIERRASAALVILACATAGSMSASCSSKGDEQRPLESTDAGSDATITPGDAGPDASPFDAAVRDAAPFDGGPLAIVCTEPPCAKSLVTTLRANGSDRGEGFCALLDDGTVACWGANLGGQLGRGEDAGSDDSSVPMRVAGLSEVIQLDHTCAVDKSGETWCWGTGPFLRSTTQAWTLERTPVKLPIPPATRVAMGKWTACAVVSDGVICWGENRHGQVAPIVPATRYAAHPPRAIELPAAAPIRDLIVGNASFALREDGTAVSWGSSASIGRVSSIFPDPYAAPVELDGVASIDIVGEDVCAAAAGSGYCWGPVVPKPNGSTDEGPPIGRALPEPALVPEPVVQVAVTRTAVIYGAGSPLVEPYRWCAVAAEGHVYCWGANASGQAGDGTKEYAFEAVLTKGLPAPAVQVKTMPSSTCALLTTGKIFCWGSNFYGQLGNGGPKGASVVPQEVVLP